MSSENQANLTRMRFHDGEGPTPPPILSPSASIELESRQVFAEDVMKKEKGSAFIKSNQNSYRGLHLTLIMLFRFTCIAGIAIIFICFSIGYYASLIDDTDSLTPRDVGDYPYDDDGAIELPEETNGLDGVVLENGDDILDEAKTKFDSEDDKKSFVIVIGDENLEVTLDEDGTIILPDGKNLNPHDRKHWEVIQAVLGDEYYDYDTDKKGDNSTTSDVSVVTDDEIAAQAGLKYVPPDADVTHEHDEDCEQSVSVEVMDELPDPPANQTNDVA